ncbi:NAD-dependent protein deacetylase [Micromonospora matsumotoense]|uniref:NAD-dependent protein deacetylase n=1 Tax=Micromonospora matsumotoense TaxID=121616 RepID=UPI003D8F98F7
MTETIDVLAGLVAAGGVVVLSGAGLSTESGIPDYRGPTGAARRHTPMTYQVFTREAAARQRYWARSHLGWRMIARAAPNDGHRAVARLQAAGLVDGVITQNVDGLHTAAGSGQVVELHGRLDAVVCLRCGDRSSREELDRRLVAANPGFDATVAVVNPDGDVELDDERVAGFRMVDCTCCGAGMLKPDVVFFGETVPADRVSRCFAMVGRARSLLVLGSSLTVLSGRRFVLRAAKLGIPVVIANQGVTRGDGYAALRVDAPLGRLLPRLVDRVAPGVTRAPGDRVDGSAPVAVVTPVAG